jgi:signal transduction histidine kinase
MVVGGRRKAKALSIALGILLVGIVLTLQIGWVVVNWRTGVMLVLGALFFLIVITGLVLNTVFLIREIRRNEQHDAFINAVTHELKTPLASMRLYLQTLQSRDLAPERRREFYGILLDDTERLNLLIEQVLRAARSSSTKSLYRTRLDLRGIVGECVEAARRRHSLSDGALSYREAVSDEPMVLGDSEELKAAITNLIENAVKYSGQQIKVFVELAQSGRYLSVRVHDAGVGIPPNELKRIFKRFYRVPNQMAQRVKGTGLGLFIVRSVAQRHGGRAFAESAGTGLGSTFTLELPLAAPSA